MSEEFLACDVLFVDAFRLELCHYLAFRRDGSMVGSRHPAGVLPVHPGLAHKYIIQSVVQHMPHMQDSCHVRRRNHYRIGFSFIRFRMEKLVFQPPGIPFVLRLGRTVLSRKFHKIYPNILIFNNLQLSNPCRAKYRANLRIISISSFAPVIVGLQKIYMFAS